MPRPEEASGEGAEEGAAAIPTITFSKLSWEGEAPPQKWMTFYANVLSRSSTQDRLKLRVYVVVGPKEGISKQKVEETKTILRELGLTDKLDTEVEKEEDG